MSDLKIISSAIVEMPYSKSTEEVIPFVRKWLQSEDKRTIEKAVRIFEMSEVNRRHSIMPVEDVFSETSFREKNNFFIQEMKVLTEKALRKALDKAELKPTDIDAIISVSCTGFMIPSMDAHLVNALRMKRNIVRLPVTEMGCAGGTSAIIYAKHYLKANPGKKVALIAFESPTATFQQADKSMTNIVSSALFSDGVAALIMGETKKLRPEIIDTEMFHFYDHEDMMGFQLENSGLRMVLSAELPNRIESEFENIYKPFLERNGMEIADINHLLFHPGGKKIIQLVEEKFRRDKKNLDVTRDVLAKCGNMSSATIFHVIDRFLQKEIGEGNTGLMLSFGPGFTAQLILVRWT